MTSKRGKQVKDMPAAKQAVLQKPERAGSILSIRLKLILILGIISFAAYVNTINNGFVLDDVTVITNNKIVQKGMSAIPEILSTPYHRGYAVLPSDLYRPVSLVVFAVTYQFFGMTASPYHLVNVLLFVCCVLLLFRFLDELFERKKTTVAFVASLIFALHPVHTEVVANIKSCDELLSFLFAFLSLNLFVNYVKTNKLHQLLWGSCCFLLSILSKETAMTFLVLFPFVFFFYRNEYKKRSGYIVLSTVIVGVISLAIRNEVLDFYHANGAASNLFIDNALADAQLSFDSRLATAIWVSGNYIKLLFVPYPLICDYTYNSIPFANFSNSQVLLSLAAYVFLIVFGVMRFIKNRKDPYVFGIFFYLVTILLVSNIFFLIGTIMGERLLFFPSVGFCLVIAFLIETLTGKTAETSLFNNKKLLGVLIPVAIIFMVLTVTRNSEWQSNYTLFAADVKKQPNCERLNFNVAKTIMNNANEETDIVKREAAVVEALGYLNTAVSIYSFDYRAQCDLCDIYFGRKKYDSAEYHGLIAYKINPNSASLLNDLGGISFIKKDFIKALEYTKGEQILMPGNPNLYTHIGLCYFQLRKFDSAVFYSNTAISMDPRENLAYETLANCYKLTGNVDSAKKYEAIIQKTRPGFKL